jgi:asparagine synthase (glutamine-hydrolysing)
MNVGFEIAAREDGCAEFRRFDPSRGAAGPALVTFAEDPRTGDAAALIGSLYYRDELEARLPDGAVCPSDSDAALALAAFHHGSLEGLEGEFALVVWDRARRRLIAMRDPLGSWPLYRSTSGGVVMVGTRLLPLARRQGVGPDPDFLASFLMGPRLFAEYPGEATAFRGVRRIAPGTITALSPDGRVEVLSRWDWMERAHATGGLTPEEASKEYARLLRAAVGQRIGRGRVAAHLSGGMDSSSVVCVARDLMAAGVGRGPLATLSMVYKSQGLAGERAYIDLVVGQGGPIEPHLLDGDSAPHFQWFGEDIPAHDEPYGGLFHLGMSKLLVDGAERSGATRVLTGLWAECLLEKNLHYLADLLRCGRWVSALAEARRWARTSNRGPASVLYRHGIEPLLPAALADGLGPMLRRGYGRWPKPGQFAVPPWVRADFARAFDMVRKGRETYRAAHGRPVGQSTDLWSLRATGGDWTSWYLAAPRGIHTSHPFCDPRLTVFCLGLARDVRQRPGVVKPLLVSAMKGVVPDPISSRRVKQGFNDVYWEGLARSLPKLEEMVRGSRIRDLGLFDEGSLIRAMRQHAVGIGDEMAGDRINSSLALIAWYDRIDEDLRRSEGEPDEIRVLGAPQVLAQAVGVASVA